jgi:hypothetical protein
MSDEPQQHDEEEEGQVHLPDEVEKSFQKLEEEEEARHVAKSNSENPSHIASAAELGQDRAEQANSTDSQQEISACFKAAKEKIEKVDADAEKKKTQIVQDLAKSLEGKIPTERICNEIVHQMQGNPSPTLIRASLDEKYNEKSRVQNALKRKKKPHVIKDLATAVLLDEEKPKQQIAVTQDGKSVILNETSSNTNASSDNEQCEENTINDYGVLLHKLFISSYLIYPSTSS